MPVISPSESVSERAIALRMRRDLAFCRQSFGRQRYWAVKDPVALAYFHLRDEEHAVLTMLDGHASSESIRRRFEKTFAPRTLSEAQLQSFLATLHRSGLVLAESSAQGAQLLERHDQRRRRRLIQSAAGLLAIRLPGVNPRPLLDWLGPKCEFLFSRAAVAVGLLVALVAVLLVTIEFDVFRTRLPEFRSIIGASNLPWLLLALAVTKILHELGHALACRRFGADCHQIGLMLLVFTPTLYCNVSDSWMLASKWQRIAVAAAGIYVELILASVCTFLWWFSQPGLFNSLCLDVMLVSSIGTVMFNGNPLLRYDGYFVLSDLVEVPNLSAQAHAAARQFAGRWFLGWNNPADRWAPRHQGLLALYALASTAYRWLVVIVVLWGLNEAARTYRLQVLVAPVICVTLAAMTWPATARASQWMRVPSQGRRMAQARAALGGLLLAMIVALVVWLPLPTRVAAPLVIDYRDAESVYVTVAGRLVSSVSIGDQVDKGQTLAALANPTVERELAKLTAHRNQTQQYLADLEARRLQGAIDGAQIPPATAALADAEIRLAQLKRDAERLTLTAPIAGTVLPPPNVPRKPRSTDTLDRWSGTPLDDRNRGTQLEVGTLVCLVGDPDHFEAILHVEQSDIELVTEGQQVRLTVDHLPGEILSGTVSEIARLDLDRMPRELAASGDLPSRTDRRGTKHPLDTWYQARVTFDSDPAHLVARVHGRAKIAVASQSLGAQLLRWLRQTFSR
jgi:putative peptide zinc metalloprotease protein